MRGWLVGFCASFVIAQDCATVWSDWSACSRSCGNGVRVQTMNVISGNCVAEPPKLQYCNLGSCPVDCQWIWTDWTACGPPDPTAFIPAPTPCGQGVSSRDAVQVQAAGGTGAPCVLPPSQTVPCQLGPACPQDCVYRQNFTEWSGSCGQARRLNFVEVITPEKSGGKPCPQTTVEYRDIPCVQNCMLSDWSPWAPCNSTCQGWQTRKRSVILYPSIGGLPCEDRLDDSRQCNADVVCPESCVGQCGKQLDTCSCDAMCGSLGDCCKDIQSVCPSFGSDGVKPSCSMRCGADDGAVMGCWCDSGCATTGDCCPDFEPQCPALAQKIQSCVERCGKKSLVSCSCDAMCGSRGDCCADITSVCQGRGSLSCSNRCGQYGALGAAIAAAPIAGAPVVNPPYTPGVPLHYIPNNQYPSPFSSPFSRSNAGNEPHPSLDFGGRRLLFARRSVGRALLLKSDWTLPAVPTCYCDGTCLQHGDCCSDYRSLCVPSTGSDLSCKGKCGAVLLSARCYCDDQCDSNDDCCSDKLSVCNMLPSVLLSAG